MLTDELQIDSAINKALPKFKGKKIKQMIEKGFKEQKDFNSIKRDLQEFCNDQAIDKYMVVDTGIFGAIALIDCYKHNIDKQGDLTINLRQIVNDINQIRATNVINKFFKTNNYSMDSIIDESLIKDFITFALDNLRRITETGMQTCSFTSF